MSRQKHNIFRKQKKKKNNYTGYKLSYSSRKIDVIKGEKTNVDLMNIKITKLQIKSLNVHLLSCNMCI